MAIFKKPALKAESRKKRDIPHGLFQKCPGCSDVVNEIELSVRAANCLNNANITTVGQLAMKTEAEMLKYRNFGKKSLNEIKEKLQQLGLSLGMKIDEHGNAVPGPTSNQVLPASAYGDDHEL